MSEINIENEISKLKDYGFFNRVMFLFENNKYVNSIFANEIKDKEYSDFSHCRNILFDSENACITIDSLEESGTYISSSIKTFTDEDSYVNNFFLVVEEDLPIGTDIIYSIVTDNNDAIKIVPNRNTPMVIPSKELPKSFKIRAELETNGINKPKINAIAIMYFDNMVDYKLGLIEPDVSNPTIV